MTKAGHNLQVGATLSDGTTTDHVVTVVIDANNVGIKHGAAAAYLQMFMLVVHLL